MTYPELVLRPNSQRLLLQGHPWVYSGAVARHHPDAAPGGIVDVHDSRGRFVGRGYYNPESNIAVRILTRDAACAIDSRFLERTLARAIRLRRENPCLAATNAYRLVHGESDGLPGLIVDEYAGFFVVQFHCLGMERLRAEVLDALCEVGRPRGVYERSDVGTRRADGMRDRPTGPLSSWISGPTGICWGNWPRARACSIASPIQGDSRPTPSKGAPRALWMWTSLLMPWVWRARTWPPMRRENTTPARS